MRWEVQREWESDPPRVPQGRFGELAVAVQWLVMMI